MNDHWRVIDNCLIYTGLDFVAFVEPANKPIIVMWQVRCHQKKPGMIRKCLLKL